MTTTPPEPDYQAIATSIVRRLTGGRWVWPAMEVRDVYDVPAGTRFIQLRGEPLIDVLSVKDYVSGDALEYTSLGNGRLELAPRKRRRDNRIDVTYTYGSAPSTLVTRAISVLAAELSLADANSGSCRLPERVTSVNRQGVNWTVIDPMEFIKDGRTGIIEVDMAIFATRPSKARARVFSPEYPPPDRLYAKVVSTTP